MDGYLPFRATSQLLSCMSSEVQAQREDLAEAIRLSREALKLCPRNHPYRAHRVSKLALALRDQYYHTRSRDDLAERIQLHREALELRPSDHPLHDISLNSLAAALGDQYNLTGSKDDLSERIRLLKEALELCPTGHSLRAYSLNNLANALRDQYSHTRSEDDLSERIWLLREVLELFPPGHPYRDHSLNNLADALGDRYRLARSETLAETIWLHELGSPDHPLRVDFLNSLADTLDDQYSYTGSVDNLTERMRLHKEALQLCPPGHPYRDLCLSNLASDLSDSYKRTTGRSNVDLAERIRLYRGALELRSPGHSHSDTSGKKLAIALRDRYSRTGSEDEIAERIALYREVLELHQPGHPLHDTSLNNLASALGDRYSYTGSEDDLAETIWLLREVLDLRSPGHPLHVTSLNNLAAALGHRYSRIGSENDLSERIRMLREALGLCPSEHPRHAAASSWFAQSIWHSRNSASDVDELFRLLMEVSTDPVSPLHHSLHCTHIWVGWATQLCHSTLRDAYARSIQLLRRYLTIGPTMEPQYETLTREADFLSLPMDAAAHCIYAGDVGKAVEILEEGRSLFWSEMRRFREPLLQRALVGDELAAEFEATCSELQRISTAEARCNIMPSSATLGDAVDGSLSTGISYDQLLYQKQKLLRRYDELLDLVRKCPGSEEFLKSLSFEKLQEAAKEGPIIIVNHSKFGSHVVIVFADRSPSVITLDEDFYDKAIDIRKPYIDMGAWSGSRTLKHVTQQLWNLVVSKVVDELGRIGVPKESRIWWCPTSALTALPFHAAGDGEHYLIDSYISSYTPTLKALIDARQPPSPSAVSESELHPRLLVVAQTIDSNLEYAGDELDKMRSLGSFVDVLDGPDATRHSVLESLSAHNCQWAHFICHGTLSESGDPFDSSLHLHGDTLSLNDIIKAHLPAVNFVFLAACHTAEQGRGESVLQDEVLHRLAGAMQFSGFRSVVGTMWAMEDKDGPKVAELFYAEMMRGDGDPSQRHTRAAQALRGVQLRMKANKNVSMDRWVNLVHIGA